MLDNGLMGMTALTCLSGRLNKSAEWWGSQNRTKPESLTSQRFGHRLFSFDSTG
jgi:hypothetical protein